MKKYYLHIGTITTGPFDFEELKLKDISKTTPACFEGMSKWATAGEIDELDPLFIVIPPQISDFTPPPTPKPNVEKKKKSKNIMGLPRNVFFIALTGLLILAGITALNAIQDKRTRELEILNHKTEIENYQFEKQQKELAKQKILDSIAETAALERMKQENTAFKKNRLAQLQQKIKEYQTKLAQAENKLSDASGFKLLRSTADKKEQLASLQKEIDSFSLALDKLENESYQLELDLEKN